MKKPLLFVLAAVLSLVTGTARANHNDYGDTSVELLAREARDLDLLAEYYGLNYSVRDAIYRFNVDVDALQECTDRFPSYPGGGGGGPIIVDPNDPFGGGHGGGPIIVDPHNPSINPAPGGYCGRELDRVQRSFALVERYLRDTNYQYPEVYQHYLSTKRALNRVLSAGPGPGPIDPGGPSYSCVAVDNGWEEHSGGHLGYGRTLAIAQRTAINECQRVHGTCRIRRCDPIR